MHLLIDTNVLLFTIIFVFLSIFVCLIYSKRPRKTLQELENDKRMKAYLKKHNKVDLMSKYINKQEDLMFEHPTTHVIILRQDGTQAVVSKEDISIWRFDYVKDVGGYRAYKLNSKEVAINNSKNKCQKKHLRLVK